MNPSKQYCRIILLSNVFKQISLLQKITQVKKYTLFSIKQLLIIEIDMSTLLPPHHYYDIHIGKLALVVYERNAFHCFLANIHILSFAEAATSNCSHSTNIYASTPTQ